MTQEEFKQKQSSMSNKELIELAEKQISKLAETGGRSHTMSVPVQVTDTDMLLSELVRRYKYITNMPDWKILREEFFKECCFNSPDNITKIDMNPHNLFEWFKTKISPRN